MTKKEVAVIEKQMTPVEIKERAETLAVTDEKSEIRAAEMLSQFNLVGDWMKKDKAKEYDPAWATVVAIRARWKPKEDILTAAISLVRSKMNKYRTDAKAKADAEAAKIAERVGEGKGKFKVDTAVRKIEEIDRPAGAVATEAGVVKYKTTQKFEVMDVTMLPIEYILPDEVAIRKAMLEGKKLPGVRYFEEQIPVNFR